MPVLGSLDPRRPLIRQILLAAAAIERGDPTADGILGGAAAPGPPGRVHQHGHHGPPQVTGYLVEQPAPGAVRSITEQVITAALDVRAAQPDRAGPTG